MLSPEVYPESNPSNGFNPFPPESEVEKVYPVRDGRDVKLEAADLFSLFTADIINEQKTFTR